MPLPLKPRIEIAGSIDETGAESGIAKVRARLEDGRVFAFAVSTPGDVSRWMSATGVDHVVSMPPLVLVRRMTAIHVERAIAELAEKGEDALLAYGVPAAESWSE